MWDLGGRSGASLAVPVWGSLDHTPHIHSLDLFHASARGLEARWDKRNLDRTHCSWRCRKSVNEQEI